MVQTVSVVLSRRAFLAAMTAAPLAAAQSRTSPPLPEELIQLAGTCVMSGWYGPRLPEALRTLLRQGALGGVLVTRHNHNFATRNELSALCAEITATAPAQSRPLIAADQEGGPVSHLTPPLPSFPSMTALGAIDDVDLTRRVGAALGTALRSVGVNFNLAPVLDVRTSPRNTVVLHRTFGRDPQKVARHGRALIDGLTSAGVLACGKHFPGHGDTSVDSHAALPTVPHDLARLDAVELVPFRACAPQLPAIMVAHVVYTGIDRRFPASLSHAVIEGILRNHLGYEGVAMSDDLQMAAIRRHHSLEQAAERSMRAGCDLLLFAHTHTVAIRVIRHLASVAERDETLRSRLAIASARIAQLRARLTSSTPLDVTLVDSEALAREVANRLRALRR